MHEYKYVDLQEGPNTLRGRSAVTSYTHCMYIRAYVHSFMCTEGTVQQEVPLPQMCRKTIIWLPKECSQSYAQKTELPVTHCICGTQVMTRLSYRPVCVLTAYHGHGIAM